MNHYKYSVEVMSMIFLMLIILMHVHKKLDSL